MDETRSRKAGNGKTGQPAPTDSPPRHLDDARGRIDAFTALHFGWPGTIWLHRRAFGLDLLRAPLNVALAPLNLLVRLAAFPIRWCGARRAANWLDRHNLILRTAVAREVETRITADLLGLDRTALPDGDSARRAAATISAYSGTRSAVAEMTVAVFTLIVGAAMFHTLTPGMISIAPTLAERMAQDAAISSFWLGSTAGGLWYGTFPVGASWTAIAGTITALIVLASALTAFAGILADPVQSWLGIHRRRLHRLVDAVERDLAGASGRPFAAREHYYARLVDLVDAGSGLFRFLR